MEQRQRFLGVGKNPLEPRFASLQLSNLGFEVGTWDAIENGLDCPVKLTPDTLLLSVLCDKRSATFHRSRFISRVNSSQNSPNSPFYHSRARPTTSHRVQHASPKRNAPNPISGWDGSIETAAVGGER
jgi:hypothetical protein